MSRYRKGSLADQVYLHGPPHVWQPSRVIKAAPLIVPSRQVSRARERASLKRGTHAMSSQIQLRALREARAIRDGRSEFE